MNKSTENTLIYTKCTSVVVPNYYRIYQHKHKHGRIYYSKCVLSVSPVTYNGLELIVLHNPKNVETFSRLRKRSDYFEFKKITEEELQEIKLQLL